VPLRGGSGGGCAALRCAALRSCGDHTAPRVLSLSPRSNPKPPPTAAAAAALHHAPPGAGWRYHGLLCIAKSTDDLGTIWEVPLLAQLRTPPRGACCCPGAPALPGGCARAEGGDASEEESSSGGGGDSGSESESDEEEEEEGFGGAAADLPADGGGQEEEGEAPGGPDRMICRYGSLGEARRPASAAFALAAAAPPGAAPQA